MKTRYDAVRKSVTGTFSIEGVPFEVDFQTHRAQFGDRLRLLDSAGSITEDLEVYVLPSIFEAAFDISIVTSLRDLTANVTSEHVLPVLAEFERTASLPTRMKQISYNHAPLIGDLQRPLLYGGVVGYDATLGVAGSSSTVNYSVRSGLRLLGGDVEAGYAGMYSSDQKTVTGIPHARWRFALPDNPWLTRISAGQLTADGVEARQIEGIEIGNQQWTPRLHFQDVSFRARGNPGWKVELYDGYSLVEHLRVGEDGVIQTTIPLQYGGTYITTKEYGPLGEFETHQYSIQAPVSLLPPGTVEYSLSAGRQILTHNPSASARFSLGLASWVGLTGGFDYLHDGGRNQKRPFSGIVLRPLPTTTLEGTYAGDAYWLCRAAMTFGSMARLEMEHINYTGVQSSSWASLLSRSAFTCSLPSVSVLPALNAHIVFDRSSSQRGVLRIDAGTFVSFGGFTCHLQYGAYSAIAINTTPNWIQSATFNTSMSVPGSEGLLGSLIGGITITSSLQINAASRGISRVVTGIQKRMFGETTLQCSHVFDRNQNAGVFQLGIQWNLGAVRGSSQATLQGESRFYSQSVAGSIAVDPSTPFFRFSRMDWIGNGGVLFHPFIDENGNSSFDEGERDIKGIRFSFGRISGMREGENEERYINVLPYARTDVEVDRESMKNPLCIPALHKFSFIAEPNMYARLDIPFFITGMLEGRVAEEDAGARGIGGLRIRAVSQSRSHSYEALTFSDGSFSFVGVVPGEYLLAIDSTQLDILRADANPTRVSITVRSTRDGDFIDGITFSVRRRAASPQEPSLSTRTDTTRPMKLSQENASGSSKPNLAQTAPRMFPLLYSNSEDRSGLHEYLDSLAAMLTSNPGFILQVDGYADYTLPAKLARISSDERVGYVTRYLAGRGIPQQQILSRSRGGTNPIRRASSTAGRMENMRVVLTILQETPRVSGGG
ncbi:MAG: hypothetical protein HY962_05400 [Ignavibacteriae bacterium]|nr:hypothetical protein [Ignavibacteriota bacterium]